MRHAVGLAILLLAAVEAMGVEDTAAWGGTLTCTPKRVDFEGGYRQLRPGLTMEHVIALVGSDMSVVSAGHDGQGKIIRWEGQDKTSFTARFLNDRLDRMTPLHRPPAVEEPEHRAKEAPVFRQRTAPPPGVLCPPPAPARQRVEAQKYRPRQVVRVEYAFGRRVNATYKHAKLPEYSLEIRKGPHELIIENPLPRDVRIGIRSDDSGLDIPMKANSRDIVYLKNGAYTIYYMAPGDRMIVYKAGSVRIDSPPGPVIFSIAG